MKDRERLVIFLSRRAGRKGSRNVTPHFADWWMERGDARGAMDYVSICHSNDRYIDTLTDKQREALMFIRMLPERKFVEGIGAWVKSKVQPGNVYIIDC